MQTRRYLAQEIGANPALGTLSVIKQAQVRMAQAQVQVSEVSGINNNAYSANSPIAVC